MPRKTKTITFDSPDEQKLLAELEKLAKAENRPFANLIKKLLMEAAKNQRVMAAL
mgnify:CR=1 FL=1